MIQKKERKTASRAFKALSQDDTDDLMKKKKKHRGKADLPGTCIVIIGDWAASPCGSGLTRRRRDGKSTRLDSKAFFQRRIGCGRREYTQRSCVFVTGKPAKTCFPLPLPTRANLSGTCRCVKAAVWTSR